MQGFLKQPVWFSEQHLQLLCRLQAGRKGLVSPASTEISYLWRFFPLIFYISHSQQVFLSFLVMPFHQVQRLQSVFTASHSLAMPTTAITAVSREQETGAGNSQRPGQTTKEMHQSTPCQSNTEVVSPAPVQEFVFIHYST